VRLLDYIFFARPLLLLPVWTVYLHYLAFSRENGGLNLRIGDTAIWQLFSLTLVFAGVYVFNQIFDIESDRINDKLHFLPRGMISIRSAWIYYLFLTLAGAAIMFAFFPEKWPVVAAIIILGTAYSIPCIRLKDNFIGGLMANAAAYGFLVPLLLYRNNITASVVFGMAPYFLAIATGYILTTIPDLEGDKASGKKTVAVILGPMGSLWLAFLTLLATLILSMMTANHELGGVALLTLILTIVLLYSFRWRLLMVAIKLPIFLLALLAGWHYPVFAVVLLLTIVLTRAYYKKRFGIKYPGLN